MPNAYVATGFNKWGMTSSNVAANIIKDEILGLENKYAEIYNSSRFQPIKNRGEMKNMAKQVKQEENPTPKSDETLLLEEIRDLLKEQKKGNK